MNSVTWFANFLANRNKRIMVCFGLFSGEFERIANLKSELASELGYTGYEQKFKRGKLFQIVCEKVHLKLFEDCKNYKTVI